MNYYEILEVSFNATQEEIKKAYRHQAKIYHPDLNSSEEAEEMMKKINTAYEILSDLSQRKAYDLTLTKSNLRTVPKNTTAYQSYTKTREESESDFEDWLKAYLKSRRKLNKLYQAYIKVKAANIACQNAYITPYLKDVLTSNLLLAEIMEEISTLYSKNEYNPCKVLSFLLSELKPVYNIIANCPSKHDVPLEKIIFQNLLLTEIYNLIKQQSNNKNEYYQPFLKYVLSKYLKISQDIMYCSLPSLVDPYKCFLKELFEKTIEANKEAIKEILNGQSPIKK